MQKLAIVGSHPDTREAAPWNDPNYEIWVFNEAPQADWCKRWDMCFQLHSPEVYTSPNNMSDKTHWEWLQQDHGPDKAIAMQEADPRVPNATRYPLEDVLERVPGADLKMLTSSPAYALAFALLAGYQHIDIYGLDMNSNTEYGYQLPGFIYWIGVCKGAGVTINHLSNRQYFSERLYGYEGETQLERDFFDNRAAGFRATWARADKDLKRIRDRVNGAILDRKYKALLDLLAEYQETSLNAGELAGALAQAESYAGRDDPISRQEFEKRSAQAQRDGEAKRALMYTWAGKTEYVYNVWMQTGHEKALQQMRQFIGEQMQLAYDTGALMGTHRENMFYALEIDKRITAAGGSKTLAALGVA